MSARNESKFSSIEIVRELIRNGTLPKKEKERLKKELEMEEEGGLGTKPLKSWDDYEKVAKELKGDLLSPGAAAVRVGITRARVHQLETEGKIRVYRMKSDKASFTEDMIKETYKTIPFWARPFVNLKQPKAEIFVFVDMPSLENYMKAQGKKDRR